MGPFHWAVPLFSACMCGIGGILKITKPGERHQRIPEAWLDAIDEEIKWRGPDGAGRFRDVVARPDGTVVEVALVHRRLSIIDHEGGGQPFVVNGCPGCLRGQTRRLDRRRGARSIGAVGRFAVVFNGCVYNQQFLRQALTEAGHVFASDHSDTEVLAHAYGEWGFRARERLDAMCAAAIWDSSLARVVLFRDYHDEKPLFVTRLRAGSQRIQAFASTIPALAAMRRACGSSSPVAPKRVRLWVRFGGHRHSCGPIREFDGVFRTQFNHVPWFGIPNAPPQTVALPPHDQPLSFEETVDLSDALISDSVKRRLEADVPIGCFLSGGVDSSLIAYHAQRQLGNLTTLTMRMPSDRLDESKFAVEVARQLGTRHVVFDASPHAADDLAHLVRAIGAPFADSSILPTYWLCNGAAEHVKVALTGDGGDELFYGYQRQMIPSLSRRRREIIRRLPVELLSEANPGSRSSKLARLVRALRTNTYRDLVSIFPTADYQALFSVVPESEWWDKNIDHSSARAIDEWQYLRWDILKKTDTASMMSGIEARAPFLSRRLWAMDLYCKLPYLRRERKAVPRALARRHLGGHVADRPKQGFAIPISDWWRSDFGGLGTLLFHYLDKPRPFGQVHDVLPINMDYVRQMIDEHWAAGGLTPKYTTRHVRKRDHGQRLFALVSLAIWAEQLDERGWVSNRPD